MTDVCNIMIEHFAILRMCCKHAQHPAQYMRIPGCRLQVVAFVKGTRTQPQCGFSHKVLTILNESRVPFEVVWQPPLQNALMLHRPILEIMSALPTRLCQCEQLNCADTGERAG